MAWKYVPPFIIAMGFLRHIVLCVIKFLLNLIKCQIFASYKFSTIDFWLVTWLLQIRNDKPFSHYAKSSWQIFFFLYFCWHCFIWRATSLYMTFENASLPGSWRGSMVVRYINRWSFNFVVTCQSFTDLIGLFNWNDYIMKL